MAADDVWNTDIEAAIEHGAVIADEMRDGAWHYRLSFHDLTVIICLETPEEITIITAWRND